MGNLALKCVLEQQLSSTVDVSKVVLTDVMPRVDNLVNKAKLVKLVNLVNKANLVKYQVANKDNLAKDQVANKDSLAKDNKVKETSLAKKTRKASMARLCRLIV